MFAPLALFPLARLVLQTPCKQPCRCLAVLPAVWWDVVPTHNSPQCNYICCDTHANNGRMDKLLVVASWKVTKQCFVLLYFNSAKAKPT